MSLDYVAYDHVTDFAEEVNKRNFVDPVVEVGFFYDEDTPVIDATAKDLIEGEYGKTYRLEGLSSEAFEDLGYNMWREGLEDSFDSVL